MHAIGVSAESIGAGHCTAALSAQLDFALMKTSQVNSHTDGTALQGNCSISHEITCVDNPLTSCRSTACSYSHNFPAPT